MAELIGRFILNLILTALTVFCPFHTTRSGGGERKQASKVALGALDLAV